MGINSLQFQRNSPVREFRMELPLVASQRQPDNCEEDTMARKALLTLIVLATTLILSLSAGTAVSMDKPIKWRMAILVPRGLSWEPLMHAFCEDVKAMSGGRLQIQEVYDGEGVSAPEILSAVSSGLMEMGMPYMALHQGELPVGVIELGLPGGPGSFSELRALFNKGGWKEVLREAYAEKGLYWLGEFFQPGTYVLTKKPIKSISDFEGLKIRCPGAYGKMIRNLGGSPVVMAFAEVYTGLATGVIDGVDGCNLIDHRDANFYEVAPYVYPLPLTSAQAFQLIVNMDDWNKLPSDLQEILKAAAVAYSVRNEVHSVIWEKEALNEMLSKGAKMSPQPSTEDIAIWNKSGREVWSEYASKSKYCEKLIGLQKEFMKKIGD